MTVSELINDKLINRQHAALLGYIRKNGAVTNRKLSQELGLPINVITPRNHELRDRGYLTPSGKTYDRDTNRTVTLFVAT